MQRTNTSIRDETLLKECFVSRLIIVCLDQRVVSVPEVKLLLDGRICHQRAENYSLSESQRVQSITRKTGH